jgi:hypothetical protein
MEEEMTQRYTEQDIARTLGDLQRRWPESTRADAISVIEDSLRDSEPHWDDKAEGYA